MRPDPRADYIVRWRYAMVAENLRVSARQANDPRRAQTLLMIADHYARLAAAEARYSGLVADRAGDASRDPPSAPQLAG